MVPRTTRSFRFSALRSGPGISSASAPGYSQANPPTAATAPAPSVRNDRRVLLCISCSAVGSLAIRHLRAFQFNDIVPADHRPEIGPSRANHLTDMNREEPDITHRQPEMLPPRPFV